MERGLYIAASGMLSELVRQDLLANDLANASTAGYKADRVAQGGFGELLLQNTRTGAPVGALGLGVRIEEQVTDLAPAGARDTGEPLDFAIEGEGFFAVQTPQGQRFTRDGRFQTNAEGVLVTALGAPVLGPGGQPVQAGEGGEATAGAIGVFAVPDAEKAGDGLFVGAAAGAADGVVRAGALEGSGVDPIRAMVDMIASLRAFEAGQRAITTIDSTLQKAANDVGAAR